MSYYTNVPELNKIRSQTKFIVLLVLLVNLWDGSGTRSSRAGEPEKKADSKKVFDLYGFQIPSYSGAYHHMMTFTGNGRWIAVPLWTSRQELGTTKENDDWDRFVSDGRFIVIGPRSGTHVASSSVRLVDLQGPPDQEHPCWDTGKYAIAAIVSGPHNTIAFPGLGRF